MKTPPKVSPPTPTDSTPRIALRHEFPATSYESWRELVTKDLKGADFDKKLVWKTYEGLDVQPIYTGDNTTAPPPIELFSKSGDSPNRWAVRQDLMASTPEEADAAILQGLASGQDAICIRFDDALRAGLVEGGDPTQGLAGRGGCAIFSLSELETALANVDLSEREIVLRAGASAMPALAMLLALAEKRGIPSEKLSGAIECDPVRELARSGNLRAPLDRHLKQNSDMVAYCAEHCPRMRTILVNSHHWHNAGASAVQELAYTLSTGILYLRETVARGADPNVAAGAMLFSFSIGSSPFMEIAKLRAARSLWAKIAGHLGVTDEKALRMQLHARTGTYAKTVYDPYNNMVRNAIEGFAGAVAGVDSMYIAPFDETFRQPDDFSRRVARNQHHLMREEAYLEKVLDPARGSYFIENLTDSLAREAWSSIQAIEKAGGILGALRSGEIQNALVEVAGRRRKAITSRRRTIVGVNNFAMPGETVSERNHGQREEVLAHTAAKLQKLHRERNASDLNNSLTELRQSAGTGNMVPLALGAVKAGATCGEIVEMIGAEATGYRIEVDPVSNERLSAVFELLRNRLSLEESKGHKRPQVYLVPMGSPGMRRARMDFCHGFFGSGGFDIVEPEKAFESPEAAAERVNREKPAIAVLCADDATYPEVAGSFIKSVRQTGDAPMVYVAGNPTESIAMLQEAGVDGFVHLRADCLETLTEILKHLGIKV